MSIKYERVLIKLSGGALGAEDGAISSSAVMEVAKLLFDVSKSGVKVGVVLGGGNILRGRNAKIHNRNIADNMGMLSTVINSLALQDALEYLGAKCIVMSSIPMYDVCDTFAQRHAIELLDQGHIVIFAGGTGHPYISTDTAAALRGAQMNAQVLLFAKNVDGVYDKDPQMHSDAIKYDELTYDDILAKGLNAIDMTAAAMCKERNVPTILFDLKNPQNLMLAIKGETIGTIVK